MLHNDLEASGIPYVTADGIADFHRLRHTFISNLAACGIHPKLAQQLARHSTIALTMDRYTHLGLIDMTTALESLPNIVSTDAKECRATGTTDDASDFGCTNGCARPAEINRFEPKSPVSLPTSKAASSANEEPRVFPRKTQENTGFSQARLAGLEPVTSGSTVRRSNQLSYSPLSSFPSG